MAQTATAKEKLRSEELALMQVQHRPKHLKFMAVDALMHEKGVVEESVRAIAEQTVKAEEVLSSSKSIAEQTVMDMRTVRVALLSLQKAWGLWAKQHRDVARENAHEVLQQMALTCTAMESLLDITREDDIPSPTLSFYSPLR